MKKIECIVKHKRMNDLEEALKNAGIGGMTVSDVTGFGNQQQRPDAYLFLPKKKIEIYVTEEQLEPIINVIIGVCQSGQSGDGKIAVFDVAELIRVRTGERGEVAV